MRRRWGFIALVGASACASLDGLAGGAETVDPVPVADAASSSDAELPSTRAEASVDAPESDGPVKPSFCASHPDALFCTSFEDIAGPAFGFSSQERPYGANLATVDGAAVFRFGDSPSKDFYLRKNLDFARAREVSISFTARIEAMDAGSFELAEIHLEGASNTDFLDVFVAASGTREVTVWENYLQGGSGGGSGGKKVLTVPASRWALRVARDPDNWRLELVVNGDVVDSRKSVCPIQDLSLNFIQVGIFSTTGPATVTYDDLLVTAE